MSAQPPSSVTASAMGFGDSTSTFHDSTYVDPDTSQSIHKYTSHASRVPAQSGGLAIQQPSSPLFTATSTSVRHLCSLLRTLHFASECQITIQPTGLNIAVSESRAMQGTIFLDKALFTTYTYHSPPHSDAEAPDSDDDHPRFNISLSALVETLNIFGASESSNRFGTNERDDYASNIRPHRLNLPFSASTLNMTGLCRFSYAGSGSPFLITLEEQGVTTTCELVTYEAEAFAEIPFDKTAVQMKIITLSKYLLDAVQESSAMTSMSSAPSSRLKILASTHLPYFSLSAAGALGSAAVEFGKSRELLETFQVQGRWVQYFKFECVRLAVEAMKVGSKVSVRGDAQGVLGLQFMVEGEGGGGMSFVDFRFVPCVEEGEDEDEESEEDGEYADGQESLVGDEEL